MKLSPEELSSMTLKPETLEFAVQQVKINGYVVFDSVLSPDFVRELQDAYQEVYEAYLQDPDPTFSKNHYRVFLPFRPPFNDERIVAHPLVVPLLDALLGEDFVCSYFASNTCAPGSEYQPAHSDIFPLFPNRPDIKPPAYHVVLNVPLVDTTEENGPIDMWPGGSHLNTLPGDQLKKLAEVIPPQPATMPAGSLMIRDGRMWHRGTLNRSNAIRPNIALVYFRSWVSVNDRIGIPQEQYDNLSERAKRIFRKEGIGAPLDTPFTHRTRMKIKK
jgi:hypothetical protein